MTGEIGHLAFNNGGDKSKLNSIISWGNNLWAQDSPNFSDQTSLEAMFEEMKVPEFAKFNIEHWDTSKLKNMSRMFYGSNIANQNLSNWAVNLNVGQCAGFRTQLSSTGFSAPEFKNCDPK